MGKFDRQIENIGGNFEKFIEKIGGENGKFEEFNGKIGVKLENMKNLVAKLKYFKSKMENRWGNWKI